MATAANGQDGQPAGEGGAGGEGGGGADGGAPAGGGPAGGATPPPGGAPPATPPRAAAPQRLQPGKGGGGGKTPPFDQHPGFRKRVNQEAERLLRKELGISMDDARAIIARSKDPAAAGGAAAGGAPAGGGNSAAQEQAAQLALTEANEHIRKLRKKLKRSKVRLETERTAMEMRADALSAGIPDKYVRFSMDVYSDLWRQASTDPNSVPAAVRDAFNRDPVDSRTVFMHVKAEFIPAAGAAPPAPVVENLDPSTSPPTSRAPGGETPKPKAPGETAPDAYDANKLSEADWRRQKRAMGIGG